MVVRVFARTSASPLPLVPFGIWGGALLLTVFESRAKMMEVSRAMMMKNMWPNLGLLGP